MKRKGMLAFATALAFTGILALYFYSYSLGPMRVELGDIDANDIGKVIETRGHLVNIHTTTDDSIILELADYEDGSTLKVYIPAQVASKIDGSIHLLPGTEVEVIGRVQTYEDKVELVLDSADGIRVIRQPDEVILTVELLARNPQIFEGLDVKVSGQITDIRTFKLYQDNELVQASTFQLRYTSDNGSYLIACLLIGEDITNDFYQGELVVFEGVFEYHEEGARYRIRSNEFTLHS